MKFRVPSYYSDFHCIADKCTDNCCVGWEIETDSDTLAYYKSVGGDFGKRLKENISAENTFILRNERCPFLNGKNLCDIIINCGEEHLCQICRDHPRYFEWYGDIKEGGVGLSCEEAARLVLNNSDFGFCESEVNEEKEEVDEELFSLLYSVREDIFLLLSENISLGEKLCLLLDFAEKLQFRIDNPHIENDCRYSEIPEGQKSDIKEIVNLFADFESIDSVWTSEFKTLAAREGKNIKRLSEKSEKFMLNLCRYFIWRYFMKGVFDEEILSKVKFAIVSVLFIFFMCGGGDALDLWQEKSKLYSKEMEYSDENREMFYDYCYEKECLSSAEIKSIIRSLL